MVDQVYRYKNMYTATLNLQNAEMNNYMNQQMRTSIYLSYINSVRKREVQFLRMILCPVMSQCDVWVSAPHVHGDTINYYNIIHTYRSGEFNE